MKKIIISNNKELGVIRIFVNCGNYHSFTKEIKVLGAFSSEDSSYHIP